MVSRDGVCTRLLKVLILAVLGFVCVGICQTAATVTVSVESTRLKHEIVGREKLVYDPELSFNYMMSKRKVPNGPDPIHNRRAGNSKRPPGNV